MSKPSRLLMVAHAGAIAVMMSFSGAAGAVECLAQPNQTPAEGERWYYRTNRQTNQKCWYLRAPDVETTGATAAPQGTQAGVEVFAQSKASPLTASQQQELFKEFLQWRIRNGM